MSNPVYTLRMDEILNTKQVLKWLSVSYPTLKKFINDHGFPVMPLAGKAYRYNATDIKAWLESKTVRGDEKGNL